LTSCALAPAVVVTNTTTATARMALSLFIVFPLCDVFFDHPIGIVGLSIEPGLTHLRDGLSQPAEASR
jgi:hypothetical protein